jgi:O-antigen ligase
LTPARTLPVSASGRNSSYIPLSESVSGPPVPPLFFFLLVFLVFLTVGRFQEALVLLINRSLSIFRILAMVMIVILPLSGRFMLPWRTTPGTLLAAFTAWIMMGIPFGIWKGGAFMEFKDAWIPSLLVFAATGTLIGTISHMRRIMYTNAISMILILVIYKRYAVLSPDGRLELAIPTIGNANDFALHILASLPFLIFTFLEKPNKIVRMILLVSGAVALYLVMQTGSRAGLLGVVTIMVAIFAMSSFTNKLKMTVAGALLVVFFVVLAPDNATRRYRTIFGGEDSLGEATLSTESRLSALKESLRQTIRRPVFGVGMGNFTVAYAASTGMYLTSHNTYTQLSSETGIPGFVMYMGILVWCFRRVRTLARLPAHTPDEKSVRNMAYCLFLTLLVFCTVSLFGSNAYRFYIPLYVGMIVSLVRVSTLLPVRVAAPPPPGPRIGFARTARLEAPRSR